ncbi:MAG: phytanoyl-CoA dioxygenase family protein [Candidatus Obscuribacterales bacterium]|nr:phytanoyl-CoA dioxygenase family protein [Candidatus Obscuribacterales bacterium]
MTRTVLENDLDYVFENLDIKGYAVMENVLSADECDLVSEKIDFYNRKQIEKFGKDRLNELKDYGVIRDLLCDDAYFQKMAMNPKVMEVVEQVVGKTAILHLQNGIVLDPGLKHYQSFFHRDFSKDFVADKVLALNVMFVIDDFNAESGATWVVPGTHKFSKVPSERFLEDNAVQVIAPPGSVFFFDGLLMHRAGSNLGLKPRRSVNHEYTRPFIKQQLDYAGMFKGKVDPESRFAQLIGLWSVPPKDVEEYRVDPDKRTYRKNQG